MKKLFILTIFFPLSLFLFGQKAINEKALAELDSLFSQYDTVGSPGIAVSIYKGDSLLISKQYGYADIDRNIKLNEYSKFNLGTISNFVTAIAVLKLTEQGKFKLTDTITTLLPGLPEYLNQVSVLNLLQHTSCIPYLNLGDNNFTDLTIKNFINSQSKLTGNPGSVLSPNIANYYILTKLVENKSGLPYWKYIKKNVFIPLGMTNSYVHNLNKKKFKTSNIVTSYNLGNNSLVKNESLNYHEINGLSNIYISPIDFNKLIGVYNNSDFLTIESINELTNMRYFINSRIFPSIAWKAKFNSGHKYLFISNTNFGCTHLLLYVPVEKLSIVILSNQYPLFRLIEKSFNLINIYSDKVEFDPFE